MLFKRIFLQEIMSTATATLLVLIGIVIAQRTAYYIDIASDGSIAPSSIKTLLGFSLLRFLPMILSLTLFLSVLLTLTRSYRDSEMVIWFSTGLGILKWIRPMLTFALPVVALIAVLSLMVVPWVVQKGNSYKDQLESKDDTSSISPGMFKESKSADRVYFVESFDELGSAVKNVFIQSTQHQKLGIITAASGRRETVENGDNFLVLQNGSRYEGEPNTQSFTTTVFDEYAIRIKPTEVKQSSAGVKSESTGSLISTMSPQSLAELQWRLATPISALILAFMAVPLSFVDPRSGRSANMIIAILLFTIYNNLLSVMQAWVSQGKVSPLFGLLLVHLFFAALAWYLLYRRKQNLPLLPSLRLHR